MGRPERLTPERQERFLEAIRRGAFLDAAARYAGYSPSTHHRYMKGETPEHAAYRDAVRLALAELEVHLGGVIKLAADSSAYWALKLAEKRFPSHWGRNPSTDSWADHEADELPRAASAKPDQAAIASPPGYAPIMVPLELHAEFTERLAAHQCGIVFPSEDVRARLRIGPDDDNPDDS